MRLVTHISAPIRLVAGRWYFVKAIHKAGLGSPYLGVAWQRPGATPPAPLSEPISGDSLSWSLPSTAPAASGVLQLVNASGGRWLLKLQDSSAPSMTLEASSDLVRWLPILNNPSSSEVDLSTLDSSSRTESKRFYRLVGR